MDDEARRDRARRRVKVLLFDIDGTLIRAGGSGRKALNRAGEMLYGVKNSCPQ